MGDAWLAAAYGEEKPELKQVTVGAFLNKIPLRQTSSLLKAQPVQASAGSSGNCNAGNIVAQNFEKVMSAFMHSLQSRTSCDETEVNLDLLRPPAKKPKAIMDSDMSSHVPTPVRNDASPSHALEDKKDPPTSQSVLPMATEAPAPQTSVRPPASTKTAPEACLEDFEDAAYGTLKEVSPGLPCVPIRSVVGWVGGWVSWWRCDCKLVFGDALGFLDCWKNKISIWKNFQLAAC